MAIGNTISSDLHLDHLKEENSREGLQDESTIDEIQVMINKRLPERVLCPYCRKNQLTQVTRERSTT